MNKSLINKFIVEHSETIKKINELQIANAIKIIIDSIDSGSKIFWCGNGGSASQANHLSAELIGGMHKTTN